MLSFHSADGIALPILPIVQLATAGTLHASGGADGPCISHSDSVTTLLITPFSSARVLSCAFCLELFSCAGPDDTRTAQAQSSAQARRVAKACGEAIQQHKTPIACLNPLKSGRTMKRTNHPYTLVILPVATRCQLSSDSFPWPNRLPSYLPYPARYPL